VRISSSPESETMACPLAIVVGKWSTASKLFAPHCVFTGLRISTMAGISGQDIAAIRHSHARLAGTAG
jgi:hypothetical protein